MASDDGSKTSTSVIAAIFIIFVVLLILILGFGYLSSQTGAFTADIDEIYENVVYDITYSNDTTLIDGNLNVSGEIVTNNTNVNNLLENIKYITSGTSTTKITGALYVENSDVGTLDIGSSVKNLNTNTKYITSGTSTTNITGKLYVEDLDIETSINSLTTNTQNITSSTYQNTVLDGDLDLTGDLQVENINVSTSLILNGKDVYDSLESIEYIGVSSGSTKINSDLEISSGKDLFVYSSNGNQYNVADDIEAYHNYVEQGLEYSTPNTLTVKGINTETLNDIPSSTIEYLKDVKSSIQTQLDNKMEIGDPENYSESITFSGNNTFSGTNTFSNSNTFSSKNYFTSTNKFTSKNYFTEIDLEDTTNSDGSIKSSGKIYGTLGRFSKGLQLNNNVAGYQIVKTDSGSYDTYTILASMPRLRITDGDDLWIVNPGYKFQLYGGTNYEVGNDGSVVSTADSSYKIIDNTNGYERIVTKPKDSSGETYQNKAASVKVSFQGVEINDIEDAF